MDCIAAKPKGVAALPKPNRFAERFMAIFPWISSWSRYSGNSRQITGESALAIRRESPLSSAIFRNPSQAHMLPSNAMDNSTAAWAPSISAPESSPKFPVTRAQATLKAIMPNHIEFNKFTHSF